MSDDTTNSPTPKRRAKAAPSKAAPSMAAPSLENAPPPPPPPPPPLPPAAGDGRHVSPRALRVALAISVALNLLVAGLALGSLFHMGGRDGRPEMTRDLAFGPFGESLRPEDRRALRDYLKARAPELRSAVGQRNRDLAAVQAALRATPFDPALFSAAIDAMRGRLEGQLTLGFDGLIEVVKNMPDPERRALADRLDRGMRRDGPDGGRMENGRMENGRMENGLAGRPEKQD